MKKVWIQTTAVLSLTMLATTTVWAGPKCEKPQEKWMKEEVFRKNVEAQGYTIKTFKVSSGKCYEIYGHDKAGKRVEIYFDPETAGVLEMKQ